jgi:predicted permease
MGNTGRDRRERDLAREIRYHLDRRTEDLVQSGLSQAEARRQAAIEFGGVAQVQEEARDIWGLRWLRDLGRDIRYAARVLAGSPGFTVTALLSLALGIGANAAIFSILHALVLRSLPVADPERLVVVTRNEVVSSPYPWFVAVRDGSRTLEGAVAFRGTPVRFGKDGATERINGALVSGTYFDVLGLRPAFGTAITNEDDRIPGSGGWRGPVAVLSYGFWLRRFGGQLSVVGSTIDLNGRPFTVAGVGPEGFSGTEVGEPIDVFAPMMMQEALLPALGPSLNLPRSQWLRIFGRLKPGAGPRQAEAELTTLLQRYNEAIGRGGGREMKVVLLPGRTGLSRLRAQYERPLWVLIAVAGLVLLIACANVAGLMLSRAAARRREIAIRLSLGAARGRLVSQLFTESLLLAGAGAFAGLVLATWMRDLLIRYLPADRALSAPIEPAVLAFTLALCAGSAIFFGLLPAWQSTQVDSAPALKGGDVAARAGQIPLRKGLVVFQMGLSLMLLTGAALFLRSLENLLAVDPGFGRRNILVASVESGPGLEARLLDAMRDIPGVESAALADSPPLAFHTNWEIYVPGYIAKPVEPRDSPSVGFVSPGYFATLGIPLLAGRDIGDRDVRDASNVMVVNETLARHFFGAENPVGRRVGTRDGVYDWEIIGVVKDGKYTGLREGPTRMAYVPARPGPWASRTVVHLRTAGNPSAAASALRRKVRDLDKAATIFDVHTVAEELDRSLLRERLLGTLTILFGGLALALAAIGLYGLMAYGVARRTREFGIRVAVGAKAGTITGLVVAEALALLAGGTAIGLAGSLAMAPLVRSMLFGIRPFDPLSAAVAVAALFLAAMCAAWIPARRAARVDPMRALRCE